MKILYISSTMNGIHSKSIYSDLVSTFRDHGHEVFVMYAREKRTKLPTETYVVENINYLGIKTGNITKNKNFLEKGISTLMIDYQFLSMFKKHWGNIEFDLVLFSTPPITMEKTLKYIRRNNDDALFYLMLKDIFPQNAIDLEIMREKSLITKYFKHKEKILYKIFDIIGVMSNANKEFIARYHPEHKNKIEVFPNTFQPRTLDYEVKRSEFGIPEDKVCLFYGGNLGKPQGIDFLIETLKEVICDDDLFFVIAGTGAEEYKITQFISSYKPKNVLYLGQLANEDFHNLMTVIDIGLIYLDYRFTIPNYPQRILAYMEAGKPVVCATDTVTDIGIDARNNNYGFAVLSNDSKSWKQSIDLLVSDEKLRKKMGINAREYFLENFVSEISYNKIMRHFQED